MPKSKKQKKTKKRSIVKSGYDFNKRKILLSNLYQTLNTKRKKAKKATASINRDAVISNMNKHLSNFKELKKIAQQKKFIDPKNVMGYYQGTPIYSHFFLKRDDKDITNPMPTQNPTVNNDQPTQPNAPKPPDDNQQKRLARESQNQSFNRNLVNGNRRVTPSENINIISNPIPFRTNSIISKTNFLDNNVKVVTANRTPAISDDMQSSKSSLSSIELNETSFYNGNSTYVDSRAITHLIRPPSPIVSPDPTIIKNNSVSYITPPRSPRIRKGRLEDGT